MYCKKCGTELKNEAAFCHKCGAAVTVPNTEAPAPENTVDNANTTATFGAPEVNTNENTQPIYQMPQYTVPPVEEVQDDKKSFSIASLILGIVSLLPCCCVNFITAILAVIFGILGIKSSNKTMSIVGIILAGVGFILYLVFLIFLIFVSETNSEDFSYFFDNNMYY